MKNARFNTFSLLILIFITVDLFAQNNLNCQLLSAITKGPTNTVAVKNSIVYFGNGSNLEVVDFTDPNNPVELMSEEIDAFVNTIRIDGNNLFLLSGIRNILIYDISQPFNPPSKISEINPLVSVLDFDVINGILYAVTWNGVEIYNVSNVANPVLAGKLDGSGYNFKKLSVKYPYVFLVNYKDSLYVCDVSDFENPAIVKIFPIELNASNVTVNGNYLYVLNASGLKVIDIGDPLSPSIAASYSRGGVDMTISGSNGFISRGNQYISLIDMSDPVNLVFQSDYNLQNCLSREIATENNMIYVAKDYGGISSIDVTDISYPIEKGAIKTWGRSQDVIVESDYAYLANGYGGLKILDVSDMRNPVLVSEYLTDGIVKYLAKSGDSLFVYVYTRRKIIILDVSNPLNPVEINKIEDTGWVEELISKNDLLFVAEQDSGLSIYNLGGSVPEKLISFSPGAGAKDIYLTGNEIFLIDNNNIFYIIDVTDPLNAVTTGSLNPGRTILKSFVEGNYAYIAAYYNGMLVVDISDPQNPVIAGEYTESPNNALDIKVKNGLAYLANGNYGLSVLNVSDLENIHQVAYFNTKDRAIRLDLKDNYAFVADNQDGIYIIRNDAASDVNDNKLKIPEHYYLHQNFPNPFNPETIIKYSVPLIKGKNNYRRITLKVYDMLGNEVATLVNKKQSPGYYEVRFNPNHARLRLPSGIYFYKLRIDNFSQTRKMVLLR